MKSLSIILIALFALALVSACEDDPAQPQNNQGAQTYQALTTREAVLNNLDLAWSQRNADEIDELLDGDFTFVLHRAGGGLPVQWSRKDELDATTRLFESSTGGIPSQPVVRSMRFDIQFDEADWQPIVPPAYPGETWYATTVFYTFRVEMEPDDTYIAVPGARAQFVVREIADMWRLVEWRDLGGTILSPADVASVNATTWGAVKALYLSD